VRSTWDYIHDLGSFRAWLARAERAAPLWNPRSVIEANLHKRYLLLLERRGVSVVPTELLPRASRASLADVLRRRAWHDVVVKPAVGAGSFATRRFGPTDAAEGERFLGEQLALRDVLIQPYQDSVDGHGERALVWIDGEFTHAVRKTPRFSGEVEQVSGALAIGADERELAERALEPFARDCLYARVDVAPGPDGRPCVMELELVEPSLFLAQEPRALARLVASVAARLSR
jgi:glutathione synthase/RimK-type ligase-like ATP-grasp enzyme